MVDIFLYKYLETSFFFKAVLFLCLLMNIRTEDFHIIKH